MKTTKRTLRGILLIVFLISCSIFNAYSLSIPKTPIEDIYVQDYALMLSDKNKTDMLQISRALEKKTSAQLVIVTIPTLDKRTIEEYSLNLFREWEIGAKDKNNGVLLLIAEKEREMRIEVGYGLEGAINDGKAGAILDQIIPYFQENDFNQGVSTAYSLLLNEIAMEYDVDLGELFVGTSSISPASLPTPTPIKQVLIFIFILLAFLLFLFLGIISLLSKLLGRNLFMLILLFLRNLASGKYSGPTGGGPYMGGGMIGRSSRGYGGRTSSRGRFGGGSSGGGGSSRKW